MADVRTVRVFIASPGDLAIERHIPPLALVGSQERAQYLADTGQQPALTAS